MIVTLGECIEMLLMFELKPVLATDDAPKLMLLAAFRLIDPLQHTATPVLVEPNTVMLVVALRLPPSKTPPPAPPAPLLLPTIVTLPKVDDGGLNVTA